MPPAGWAIGVDVGGTKVSAGLVAAAGGIVVREYADTPHRSTAPHIVEDVIVHCVTSLLSAAEAPPDSDTRISTDPHGHVPVGIGAAGFVDADRGMVRFAPHLNWRNEPLSRRLAQRLGRPVIVENDANAAAWAEHRFGAGRDEPRLILLTLGTGIGGGMVFDGALERGAHGMAAEFGHMTLVPGGHRCECGNRGCWEQYASGSALRREALERLRAGGPRTLALSAACHSDPGALTGQLVTTLAQAADPEALEVLEEVGRGLASVVAALDPGRILIGGGMSEAGELLLRPAREALAAHLTGRGHRPQPSVRAAALGPDAGLIGAADLARLAAGAQR